MVGLRILETKTKHIFPLVMFQRRNVKISFKCGIIVMENILERIGLKRIGKILQSVIYDG